MNLIQRMATYIVQKSALYDLHPELEDRVPILRISSDDPVGVEQNTFKDNATSFTNHMWLQKAVNVLANNIAPLGLRIVRGPESDVVENHPLTRLFDNPNPDLSPEDLWRAWVVDQMNGGEWGLEVVKNNRGEPLELWPKQPPEFSVRPASLRYRRVQSYKIDDGAGDPYNLIPEEFIHFKFYNPLQPFRGLSPISAVKLSISIDQLAQAWSRLFFKNNARPDFAVIAPEGVTQTEKQEILAKLRMDHSGRNAHEPVVLEEGVTDIKVFSWPAKDMEWVNQREMSRDEVAAIVGVPDELMGYGRDTYENFDTADRVFWTLTVVPLTGMRDGSLTRFFRRIKFLKPDERVMTDLRNVPQLQEDKAGKITQAKTLFDMGIPVNVASEHLNLGLPPIPGGDIGYLNSAMVPVDQLPFRPAAPPILSIRPPQSKDYSGTTKYGSEEHAAQHKKLQARLDSPVAELQRIIKREFQRQQNEINAKLRAGKTGKTYGRGKFKDTEPESIPSPEELFNLQEEIQKLIDALKKKLLESVEQIAQDELSQFGEGVFDIDRPEVVKQVMQILQTVSEKTNNTTWTALVELFQAAESLGEGIPKIQERLSAFFGDRKSDYQTERIARTTMTGASNAGTQQAWNQAEEDGVQMEKEWISALQPNRSRESHMEAHGQRVGLHESFLVDGEYLEYPGDPSGSPGNIINCLCGMIGVVKE